MTSPRELQELYERGENIMSYLRSSRGNGFNSREAIEISYDLQTGSYTAAAATEEGRAHKQRYTFELARQIAEVYEPASILEAGVGEATTLSGVIDHLGEVQSYGFDLSWSRVAYARRWLESKGVMSSVLCTGDLIDIPFASNSIDVVYTSHAIEPNRGREERIIEELYRVCRKALILLEPGYELANDEQRARMEAHGYCRDLAGTASSLGMDVREHQLFPHTSNPMNPTAITTILKDDALPCPSHVLACPRYKTLLRDHGEVMFSPEALAVYPVLGGIPCLRVENGIVASKYEEIVGGGPQP